LKIVVDTNVLVEAIAPENPYNIIFTSLVEGDFYLCVSNSIALEYEETVSKVSLQENVGRLLGFLDLSSFVIQINPHFSYSPITADPDDNKFVDCAVAANADYIVTSDRHFDILRDVSFPKIAVIHPEEFIRQFLQ